jgi:hypothetical protein
LIRSIKRLVLAGVAAATLTAVAFAGPASASVTVNADGTGFVGKGDVQTAFGWNNAKLQTEALAGHLSFTSVSTETWEWDETWDTGIGTRGFKHHEVTKSTVNSINAVLNYSNRQHSQVDGIFLEGFNGAPTVSGDYVPYEGEVLVDPQNPTPSPTNHVASNVVRTSSSGPSLFVSDSFLGLGPVDITPAPVVS